MGANVLIKARRIFEEIVAVSVLLGVASISAPAAFAQGCALCYNDAASTGPQGIAALRHGILILAIPPMLIFAALFAALYKRRNLHHGVRCAISTPSMVSASSRSDSDFVLHLN